MLPSRRHRCRSFQLYPVQHRRLRCPTNESEQQPRFRYYSRALVCREKHIRQVLSRHPMTCCTHRLTKLASIAINAFFTTWNTAVIAAALDANLISQDLIQAVDPVKQTHVGLFEILTALAVGLAFIIAPEIAPEALIAVETAGAIGVSATTAAKGLTTAAHALTVGVQQAPGLGKAIWPEGTTAVSTRGSLHAERLTKLTSPSPNPFNSQISSPRSLANPTHFPLI